MIIGWEIIKGVQVRQARMVPMSNLMDLDSNLQLGLY